MILVAKNRCDQETEKEVSMLASEWNIEYPELEKFLCFSQLTKDQIASRELTRYGLDGGIDVTTVKCSEPNETVVADV
jgi:hypothetical protein